MVRLLHVVLSFSRHARPKLNHDAANLGCVRDLGYGRLINFSVPVEAAESPQRSACAGLNSQGYILGRNQVEAVDCRVGVRQALFRQFRARERVSDLLSTSECRGPSWREVLFVRVGCRNSRWQFGLLIVFIPGSSWSYPSWPGRAGNSFFWCLSV